MRLLELLVEADDLDRGEVDLLGCVLLPLFIQHRHARIDIIEGHGVTMRIVLSYSSHREPSRFEETQALLPVTQISIRSIGILLRRLLILARSEGIGTARCALVVFDIWFDSIIERDVVVWGLIVSEHVVSPTVDRERLIVLGQRNDLSTIAVDLYRLPAVSAEERLGAVWLVILHHTVIVRISKVGICILIIYRQSRRSIIFVLEFFSQLFFNVSVID